jgi:hypothetical protein
MAQLSSPGVVVPVIDESFYTPAAPGTVPLIVVASQENKATASGSGIAPGTLKANAGKAYLLTSQMDLGNTFGIPYFQTDANNNPINASEVNEYGLQAAYSFLGVSGRAYVVRADLDTAQLIGSEIAPTGAPDNGTLWFDTVDTNFGVFEWNSASATVTGGQTFTHKDVLVINDSAKTSNGAPLASIGAVGSYAVVTSTANGTDANTLWLKKFRTHTAAGTWVEVGSTAWTASWPVVSITGTTPSGSDTFTLNGHAMTSKTSLAAIATAINTPLQSGITAEVINDVLYIYSTGADVVLTGNWNNIQAGTNGTYAAPALQVSPHYNVPTFKISEDNRPTGSIWVKATTVNQGAHWFVKKYNSATAAWVEQSVNLYPSSAAALAALDPKGGGLNLAINTLFVKYNTSGTPDFTIFKRKAVGPTSITSVKIVNATLPSLSAGQYYSFDISETGVGNSTITNPITVTFSGGNATTSANAVIAALQAALADTLISATLNDDNTISISHTAGGDIIFTDGTHTPLAALFSTSSTANYYVAGADVTGDFVASLWTSTTGITASEMAPTTRPENDRLWYNTSVEDVDIMVNDGSAWKGYRLVDLGSGTGATDPKGPIISATQPTTQSDGTALAFGDIWIDTSDLENFPMINKWNDDTKKWVTVDNADQTTENGVLFHDARWSTAGANADPATIAQLLTSDFLDFDAPEPALYPKGMLLWNLRRSSYNVKKYVRGYVDTTGENTRMGNELMNSYFADRWVSEAPNLINGAGAFGRKAQREVVLKALQATIQSNQEIRQPESRIFNLLSCPGYLETLKSLVALNTDNGQTAFIVADAPARLTSDATTLNNWGKNLNNAAIDGEDGLVTTDAYAAVYYPWGYTQDLLGNNIVVPPSHMMLRTIALSDNVSYPWFAPAGTRRGGITNASSTGYVDPTTGEFTTVALNTGQRDTLADIHVNPITYLAGTGLVAYGQKTRQLVASSLDRINVARLVVYLRRQLDQLAKPYVFEPNDTITRNEIKHQIESLLLELVGQRALYDYLVVCDTSNNTPSRIDANELHVDIAIEPVKAVEFIYIPLRLENTGAIKALG